jgi:hypothetical protein
LWGDHHDYWENSKDLNIIKNSRLIYTTRSLFSHPIDDLMHNYSRAQDELDFVLAKLEVKAEMSTLTNTKWKSNYKSQ